MTHPLPLSEERVREIKEGCEGVTPGPWKYERGYKTDWVGVPKPDGRSLEDVFFGVSIEDLRDDVEKNTALRMAHIARLDPQTVSALCDLALTTLRANSGEVTEAEVEAAWNAMLLSCVRSDTVSRKGMRPALEAAARIRSQHQKADQ